MDNNEEGYARINVRSISEDEITICCHKNVKLKNYLEEDICIIGIGDSGIDTVKTIIKCKSDYLSLMVDIDHVNLSRIKAKNKLYIMGDIENREMLTRANRRTLTNFSLAHDRVYLVARLDNELNLSKVLKKIVLELCRPHREIILIVIKPYLFELPHWRVELINNILKELEKSITKLMVFDSEDLLSLKEVGELPLKESATYLNNIIATVIEQGYSFGDEVVTNIRLDDFHNE